MLLIVMVAFINHVNAMNVQSGSESVSFGVKKMILVNRQHVLKYLLFLF